MQGWGGALPAVGDGPALQAPPWSVEVTGTLSPLHLDFPHGA